MNSKQQVWNNVKKEEEKLKYKTKTRSTKTEMC